MLNYMTVHLSQSSGTGNATVQAIVAPDLEYTSRQTVIRGVAQGEAPLKL